MTTDNPNLDTELFSDGIDGIMDELEDLAPVAVDATIEEAFEMLTSQVDSLVVSTQVDNDEDALVEVLGGAVSDLLGIEIHQAYTSRDSDKKPYKINAYSTLYDGHTLVLFIAKRYRDASATMASQDDCTDLAKRALNYVDFIANDGHLKLPEGSEDREIGVQIKRHFDDCKKLRFSVLLDRQVPVHTHFSRKRFRGREIAVDWWGIEQFASATDGSHASSEIVLDIPELLGEGKHLFCLESSKTPEGMQVYTTLLPGEVLYETYNRWGQSSMRANVRAYLSAGKGRTKTNRGIANTVREKPSLFLAYNNGITLTATEVETYTVNGRPAIRKIKGLQIVNGGQTTASLFYAGRKNLEQVEVNCKIVAVLADPQEHVKDISTFSNRQNQVKESDLSSNDRFNVSLQQLSRTTALNGEKWYYERTASQYANEVLLRRRKGDLVKFELEYPKARSFDKTDAASVLALWEGFPHDVSAGGQTNFVRWHKRNRSLLDDPARLEYTAQDFKDLVAKIIIWRTAQAVHKPRYKDYRRQVSNFTVALVAKWFADRIDLKSIWDNQAISTEFCDAIGKLGDEVISRLKDEAQMTDRDVTYICKRPAIWEKLKDTDFDVDFGGVPEIMPEA